MPLPFHVLAMTEKCGEKLRISTRLCCFPTELGPIHDFTPVKSPYSTIFE